MKHTGRFSNATAINKRTLGRKKTMNWDTFVDAFPSRWCWRHLIMLTLAPVHNDDFTSIPPLGLAGVIPRPCLLFLKMPMTTTSCRLCVRTSADLTQMSQSNSSTGTLQRNSPHRILCFFLNHNIKQLEMFIPTRVGYGRVHQRNDVIAISRVYWPRRGHSRDEGLFVILNEYNPSILFYPPTNNRTTPPERVVKSILWGLCVGWVMFPEPTKSQATSCKNTHTSGKRILCSVVERWATGSFPTAERRTRHNAKHAVPPHAERFEGNGNCAVARIWAVGLSEKAFDPGRGAKTQGPNTRPGASSVFLHGAIPLCGDCEMQTHTTIKQLMLGTNTSTQQGTHHTILDRDPGRRKHDGKKKKTKTCLVP